MPSGHHLFIEIRGLVIHMFNLIVADSIVPNCPVIISKEKMFTDNSEEYEEGDMDLEILTKISYLINDKGYQQSIRTNCSST